MARKKLIKTTTPAPSSTNHGEEKLGENDAVGEAEGKEESPVKGRESLSGPEEDSVNTAPSPNVSDFIIKPIISRSPAAAKRNKPNSKRSAESELSGTATQPKKEKVDSPRASIVLGLPKLNHNDKSHKRKLTYKADESVKVKRQENGKVEDKNVDVKRSENVDLKRLSELLKVEMLNMGMGIVSGLAAVDFGMASEEVDEIGEKWNKFQEQMLELYIKRIELVQEQTKLVLDTLGSSSK